MFAHETMVSLIFLVLNFALLVFIISYFFTRYALPIVRERMAYKKESLQKLHDQKEQLLIDQRTLEEHMQVQDVLVQDLRNKIERWHATYKQHRQERYQELERSKRALVHKRELQEKTIELDLVVRKALPKILEESALLLHKKFETEGEGRAYLKELTTYMKGER